MTTNTTSLNPAAVQAQVEAWKPVWYLAMGLASVVSAAVTHFLHLAINKWGSAGGWQGIQNFLKFGNKQPTQPITKP